MTYVTPWRSSFLCGDISRVFCHHSRNCFNWYHFFFRGVIDLCANRSGLAGSMGYLQQYRGASGAVSQPLLLSLRRLVPRGVRHRLPSQYTASPRGGMMRDHGVQQANCDPLGSALRGQCTNANVRAQHAVINGAPVALPCRQPCLPNGAQERMS